MGTRRRGSRSGSVLSRAVVRRHIDVPGGGPTQLAVLSDTHGHPHRATAKILRRRRPLAILHAGDVGSAGVVSDLERIAPTHAVRGNVDSKGLGLPEALVVDVRSEGVRLLRMVVVHVGIARLRLVREVRELATEVGAAMVICGHSHLPWLGRDGDLVVFNPGSNGPRRFDYPVTLGCLEISSSAVRPFHVDCETGGRWVPG